MNTKYFIIGLILIQISILGCSSSRFQKKGDIVNTNYTVEIPFRYENDMILVDVKIDGNNYTFMWDTGAELNVIDQSIADEINAESTKNMSIRGSDNTSKKMGRLALPPFSIGQLDVEGSVAVISDMSPISRFLGCYDIKGIIGNNVMRRGNMQIDYEKEIITMTDSEQPFQVSKEAHVIKMNTGKNGNVKLKLSIGAEEQYVTFDSGYGGKLKSNNISLIASHPNLNSYGVTGASLHKVNKGSIDYVFIREGELAGIPFQNQGMVVNESGASLVGNEFLSNFVISVNWERDELIFDPIETMKADTIKPFELKIIPNFNSSKIEIAKLYPDHTDFEAELIGWQVDKINGADVSQFNKVELCEYWDNQTIPLKKLDTIELQISNKGEMRNIEVNRFSFDHGHNDISD